MMLSIRPFRVALLALVIGGSVFSYLPLIQAGRLEGMNLDIAFLYLLVAAATIATLPSLWRNRAVLWSQPVIKVLVAFQLYATASIIWSENLSRGIMTVGFGWLLLLIALAIVAEHKNLKKNSAHIKQFATIMLIGTCIFAIWQVVGDALHLPTIVTLSPGAYQGGVFGIARPTGFAVEPQFLGSVLLIPFGILLYKLLQRPSKQPAVLLFLVTITLLLTVSRGALLGAVVIAAVLIASLWPGIRRFGQAMALFGAACLITLAFIMALASLRAGSLTKGYLSTRAVIEHVSLGKLALPTEEPTRTNPNQGTVQLAPQTPAAPGYVEDSTVSRLSMVQLAIQTWRTQPMIGVGSGGFGAAAHRQSPELYAKNTVANNYYFEMLAELGIIGVSLFSCFIILLLSRLIKKRTWLFVALICGALIQWYFFSGNANVIHVWLLFGFAIAATLTSPKKAQAFE